MKKNLLSIIIFILVAAGMVWLISTSVTSEKKKQNMLITTTEYVKSSEETAEARDYEEKQDVIHGTIEAGNYVLLNLDQLYQDPELPAGCESVSMVMLLNYYGYDLEKTAVADRYLVYSGNFVAGFDGNPYQHGGCYAPGMTLTANSFFAQNGRKHTAVNISGTSLTDLFAYLDAGKPVLVWCTIGLCPRTYGRTVTYEGSEYAWDIREHCVVLGGYSMEDQTVTLYDPIDGTVTYPISQFEPIYDEMYRMAIVFERN